ncbi:MAG: asparagine synthase (glutamine-hydrolyzing) [Casimicrobiaceae bacterium]
MCGIAGWMFAPGTEPGPGVLERMARAIGHRGPDDEGFFRDPGAGVALVHRRLAIIDLSAASHQPLIDEASGLVLTYNGEIYNFRALRRELEALGHRFSSAGDAEVLLRAWLQWGAECLSRLVGMFAFALWDPRSATLHLARDATGMKPLYFCRTDRGLVFASEIKAFLSLPHFSGRIDPTGLQQYLEFGYRFAGRGTMLAGIEKLLPGERLVVRGGSCIASMTWFEPPAPDRTNPRGESERLSELSATLQAVVAEHLNADVPVGLLLSGGLDSGVVAALAARSGRLTTLCMGFGHSDVDERPHARQVADFIGSDHHEVLICPREVRDEVTRSAWVFDDLFADWGTVTTRLLYRRCRQMGLKVVLVGEGADELFGGYDVFNRAGRLGLWQLFRVYQRYCGRRWGRVFGPFRAVMVEHLRAGDGDPFHAIRLFESRQQLPNNYVMKVDKASMSESVEARCPYLDRRVAELAWRTPSDWLRRQGENKYLLRALARKHALLPPSISNRKKFGAPLASGWMDDDAEFRSFARGVILAPGSQTECVGLARAMRAYFDERLTGYAFPAPVSIFRHLAWRLLLLELWARVYVKGHQG